MSGSQEYDVYVYLYDLSQGMAKSMSMGLLGKQIDGIWHTGIVVYGYEYFYGGGIQHALPGQTQAGVPQEKIKVGTTCIPQELFHEFLQSIASRFTPETYDLLTHNCNNFSNECAQFLTGESIPAYITGLPEEALSTPMGQMFRPMIDQMQGRMRAGGGGGAVPWGDAPLNLPPLAAARASAAPAPARPPHVVASGPASQTAAQAQAQAPGFQNLNTNANQAALAAALAAAATNPQSPGSAALAKHPHAALKGLTVLSAASKPAPASLPHPATRHGAYEVLVRSASSQLADTALQLSPAERSTLHDAVAALRLAPQQVDDRAVQSLSAGAAVLARLIVQWPVDGVLLLGPLNLFGSVLLQPRVFMSFDSGPGSLFFTRLCELASLARPTSSADAPSAAHPSLWAHTRAAALRVLTHIAPRCPLALLHQLLAVVAPILQAEPPKIADDGDDQGELVVRERAAALLLNIALALGSAASREDESEPAEALVEALCAAAFALNALTGDSDIVFAHRLALALAWLVFGNSAHLLILSSCELDTQRLSTLFTAPKASASASAGQGSTSEGQDNNTKLVKEFTATVADLATLLSSEQ